MGVIFFIYNAAFSTILLIIVLVATAISLFAKNPDTRYQPMRDDRGSFIKSQSQLTTELDALGATARGESKHGFTGKGGARIEDDDDSWSGGSSDRVPQAQNPAYQGRGGYEPPRSPISNSAPGFPSDNGSSRHVPPSTYSRTGSMTSEMRYQKPAFRQQGASPSPWQRGAGYE